MSERRKLHYNWECNIQPENVFKLQKFTEELKKYQQNFYTLQKKALYCELPIYMQ